MIKDHKKAAIKENYNQYESKSEMSFKDYVIRESENDPRFFAFLFDEEFDTDFDSSLTDEQKQEFSEYINTL